MVGRAKEVGGDEIYLALAGFHLGGTSEVKIRQIIADLRRLGVQKVAPSHCTGDQAINAFRQTYGQDFIESGAGKVLFTQVHRSVHE